MNNSIIIIGRGSSVQNCTKEFVDSHDEVAIVNYVIYNNYEHLVSNHADYLFGNRTSFRYSNEMVEKLGLKEMIFTGNSNQKFDKTNPKIKINYPKPTIAEEIINKYKVNPSSGMQCLYYLLNKKKYNKISIVGFDFYELNSIPYYFKPSEAALEQKYLWNNTYKDNKINEPSGHNTDKSIELFKLLIEENIQVNFTVISNSNKVNQIELKNLNKLK